MESDEAERSPFAPVPDARALAFTKTPSTVISPPKSETERTEALPLAVAPSAPAPLRADGRRPAGDDRARRRSSSRRPSPLSRGGAETAAEAATVPSGSTTRTPSARADESARSARPPRPPGRERPGRRTPRGRRGGSPSGDYRPGTAGGRGSIFARRPEELRGDEEQEDREQLPQQVLVQGGGQRRAADDARRPRRAPTAIPAFQRTFPALCCCQAPKTTTGIIAASEVAWASIWLSPTTSASVGTKRMPPPTPKRPERIAGAEAEDEREDDVVRAHSRKRSDGDADDEDREQPGEVPRGDAVLETHARERADQRGQADEGGRVPVDVVEEREGERPGDRRDPDGRQRGRRSPPSRRTRAAARAPGRRRLRRRPRTARSGSPTRCRRPRAGGACAFAGTAVS